MGQEKLIIEKDKIERASFSIILKFTEKDNDTPHLYRGRTFGVKEFALLVDKGIAIEQLKETLYKLANDIETDLDELKIIT